MTEKTMLERVKDALYEHGLDACAPSSLDLAARAAIAALREPSEAMIDAFRAAERGCTGPREWIIQQAWPKFIDAALA